MKKGYLNLIIYALIAFAIIMFAVKGGGVTSESDITYNQFIEKVNSGDVSKVIIGNEKITIYDATDSKKVYYTGYLENDDLVNFLTERGVDFEKETIQENTFLTLFLSLLPSIIIFILFLVGMNMLMNKSGGAGGNGIMSVGKNKSKLYLDKDTGVHFDDVAGQDEAKESLTEIIDYLHNKDKYVKIGAKLPKGVLLVGPPGTGKTLLAKAVAGEAHVPFFSLSGSDFVEMFVGVGASRVRDLFEDAKKHAPCIVFIDEIDSIGKARGNAGGVGGHDEREQTLNQLLAEMDGFEKDAGIIILAATNRPEILDEALLRPGRFDRRVIVNKPDLKGRIATLEVHSKNVKLDETVDLKNIALATSGAAGADLANIINEAALGAVRRGENFVGQKDLLDAVETVFAGKAKKDRVMTESERRLVAYHEVGHAVVSALQKGTMPVQKITIIPRTMGALGFTWQVPEEEKYLLTRNELCAEVRTLLGGRCAEEVFFNEITTGASNDIEKATEQIRSAITIYGMSDVFGMVALEKRNSMYLNTSSSANCANDTIGIVDREVSRIMKRLHNESKKMLEENSDMINEIANFLLEKETINGDEFMEIFRKYIPEGKSYNLDNDTVFESNFNFEAGVAQTIVAAPAAVNPVSVKKEEKAKPLAAIVKTSSNNKSDEAPKDNNPDESSKDKEEIKVSPLESKKETTKTKKSPEVKKEDLKLNELLKDTLSKKEESQEETSKPEEKKVPDIKIEVEKKELPFEKPVKTETNKREVKEVQVAEPKPLQSNNGGNKNKKKKRNNNGGASDMAKLMGELNSGNLKNEKKKQSEKPAPTPKEDNDDDISEDMYKKK